MNKREKDKLQRLIDRAAETSSDHFKAVTALDDFCLDHFGATPSELDADSIIDAVLGGGGEAAGMKAEEFIAIMKNDGREP
jgi:hypothetical protein